MSLYFDEADAIEFLRSRGYRVTKVEFPNTEGITTTKKLVEYFYAMRFHYNSDRPFPPSIDWQGDNRCAADLVRSRQKLGLSRKDAIREAAALVEALFKFEEFLNLKEPVYHLTILTSRPVMDRVCGFLNAEVNEIEEFQDAEYIDKINKIYDQEYAQRDFDKAAVKRKEIWERLRNDKPK